MTRENRNVWYLGVVLAAFLVVQAGTGFQLLAATGLPLATGVVPVYDLCEETCGPEQNCEEPCFPEPETGLITCGEYEDGWEGGWCLWELLGCQCLPAYGQGRPTATPLGFINGGEVGGVRVEPLLEDARRSKLLIWERTGHVRAATPR